MRNDATVIQTAIREIDMKLHMTRSLALSAATLLLASCGGGSDSELKRDGLREIGVLANVLMPTVGLLGSPASVARSSLTPVLGMLPASECTDGDAILESGEADRPLVFYNNSSGPAYYDHAMFVSCRASVGTTPAVAVLDGDVEVARLKQRNPSDLASPVEYYAIYGGPNGDYTAMSPDASFVERLVGRIEFQSFDNFDLNSAAILSRSVDSQSLSGEEVTWAQGKAGDPFRVEANNVGSGEMIRFKFNGPYTYTSTRCGTLERKIAMSSPASISNDGSPFSGSLTVELPELDLIITFDDMGRAIVEGPNGSSATLSAEEIQSALDNYPC